MTDDPRIGNELAGHRIEELIGHGGMGVVYRAEQIRLGRKVALKLLAPELAENQGFRVRFEHESRLAAAIDHPNIIPLYEAGEADGLLFITMRYVEGTDLKAHLARRGPLDLRRTLDLVGQLAGALDAAHARGLVHRDVKPANILLASRTGADVSDHCYLTDFGLTKDMSQSIELTATGQFVGTIDYVAPEQIQGNVADGRADLYSLACVFHECLTGKPPFQRSTDVAVIWAHLQDEPPGLSSQRPDLPAGLDVVLAKAMSKEPEDRYPTCSAFVAAARVELEGGPPTVPPASAGAAGLTRPSPRPRDGPPQAGTAVPAGETRPATAPPAVAAGATRPATAPQDRTAAPVPAAAVAPARGTAPPRRLVTAGLAVAALAGLAGVLAAPKAGSGEDGTLHAAGPLRLTLPASWREGRPPGPIEGLQLVDPIQLVPAPLDGRAALLAGPIGRPGPALITAALAKRLREPALPPRGVSLGRVRALVYRDLPLGRSPGRANLYVIATGAGPMAVGCTAAPDATAFLRLCEDTLGSLDLKGAEAQDPLPDARYARELDEALRALERARRSGVGRLQDARTSVAQLAAARALAAEHARLASRVEAVHAPAAARGLHDQIVSAALEVSKGYRAAAAALAAVEPGAYRAAGAAARAAQAELGRRVAALALIGYRTAG